MKKTLLITSTIMSLFSLIGCSNFEDTTSVGSQLIDEADPSFLDFGKNYTTLSLDTNIVTDTKSVPNGQNSTNFGVHVSSALPVGEKNGEVSSAYYEFKTSLNGLKTIFENWKKLSGADSLIKKGVEVDSLIKRFTGIDSLINIYSTVLVFDTINSSNKDCNYAQDVRIIRVRDSSFKYNRNEASLESIFNNQQLLDTGLSITNLTKELSDTTFNNEIFSACSLNLYSYISTFDKKNKTFNDSSFNPQTFQFVVASKDSANKFAILRSSAKLRVHFIKGELKDSAKAYPLPIITTIDTISKPQFPSPDILPGKLPYDTMVVTSTLKSKLELSTYMTEDLPLINDSMSIRYVDTIINLKYPSTSVRRRVKSGDTTLVIDSITIISDSLRSKKSISYKSDIKTTLWIRIDSLLETRRDTTDTAIYYYTYKTLQFKVDTTIQTTSTAEDVQKWRKTTIFKDTIIMKADSFDIPFSYSNYVMYETKDLLQSRANLTSDHPISSYGPQRTAVFELNIDSLWNTLKQQPTDGKPAFNKILSAGVAITGKLDSSFLKSMSDETDTAISVKWFVADKIYYDGLQAHKTDKFIGRNDTLKNGQEIVLPIEKNLQEFLSRTSTLPSIVYLHLETLSTKNFNKQVFWSKPSLITVLTTSTKN